MEKPAAAGFSKLVRDTIYGIEKDLMKVALLAGATLLYKAATNALRRGPLISGRSLQGGPLAVVLLAFLVGVAAVRKHYAVSQPDAAGSSPVGPIAFALSRPLGVAAMVVGVFVVDRLDLLVGVQRVLTVQLSRFIELVIPGLFRIFPFLRAEPPAPAARHFDWRPAAAIGTAALGTVQIVGVRSAARAREAQRLLDAQPVVRKLVRYIRCFWCQQGAQAEKCLSLLGSIIGTGSAFKYLVSRGRVR